MAGWIFQLYNLSVLIAGIIEVYLACVHMLQLVKQIIAAGAVSISQTNTITTGNSKAPCLYMILIHNYDMGVAMVDCVIVTVYTLAMCFGVLLNFSFFIVHWVIKRRKIKDN